ncbi:unnamed protein product [Effrenium voratum]|nr:unnamed protein product [Effrenium voratum]
MLTPLLVAPVGPRQRAGPWSSSWKRVGRPNVRSGPVRSHSYSDSVPAAQPSQIKLGEVVKTEPQLGILEFLAPGAYSPPGSGESEGVFLGRRYVAGALRFLRPVRGASSAGYAIIIADGNGGYVQVADAHEETDFCEMLQKLNSTACDVMAVAMTCADQMQLLHRVIEKAKQVPQPSAAMAHELSEIEKLERTLKQRDRELAECQGKLRQREAELQDAKEQLLLLQGRLSRRQEAEEEFVAGAAVEALKTADPVGSKRSGPFGVPSRPSLGPCQPPEANLKDLLEVDGDLSEVLLRGRVFRESPAMGFWQLAKASYNHQSSGHVEEDGKLWLVVAEVQRTNTRVIARESSPGALELGFRGTVSEDSGGASQANWASNLDSELVSLDPRFHRSKVGSPPKVHKGFQEAYGAVASQVVAWLRGVGRGRDVRRVRLAGHSLGGALATLALGRGVQRGGSGHIWQSEGGC